MRAMCAGLIAIATCVALAQPRDQVMRIVSTSPSTTEMLFALGLGDRVVGVSQFCRYPPQVTSLPKVGTILRPDLERIVTLRPDLVVISDKNAEFGVHLAAAQIPFVAVATRLLTDVSSAMVRIGGAAGVEAHARTVVADMVQRLDTIKRRSPVAGRPKVLLIMGRAPDSLTGIVAVGAGSYLNELVTIAGGVNVVAAVSTVPYPKLSIESILRMDPDVIVDTIDMGATERDREQRTLFSRALWQRYQTVSAVRTGRIHAAEPDALFIPGPRVVDAAEWLAQVIHADTHP